MSGRPEVRDRSGDVGPGSGEAPALGRRPATTPPSPLHDRAAGCLAGAAVADALGAPTETRTPEQIRRRYDGWVTGIVPPWHENWREARLLAPHYQGNGRLTDDTLMTHGIVAVYLRKRDHIDAFDAADHLVPYMIEKKKWIPEMDEEALVLHRVFLSLKWIVLRLYYGHIEPREAGVGNVMDAGAAMSAAPIGIVNAGNPAAAYREAIDFTGAHQHSFAREAAGVQAAAVAAAMAPDATADSVIDTVLSLAKDGTGRAIEQVCRTASRFSHWTDAGALTSLREAVAEYDTMGPDYTDLSLLSARRPSRIHSIEELPIALGMLVMAKGKYVDTVLGGVNYGRCSDTIATLGGAIAGALGGLGVVPAHWVREVSEQSRTDIVGPGLRMADVALEVFQKDQERRLAQVRAFESLQATA